MTTVESVSRSSAWTMTAYRRPSWTRPRPRGIVIAWTSPRTTQPLHQRRHVLSFRHVCLVLHQRACLGGETASAAVAFCCLSDGLTSGLGTTDAAPSSDLVESAKPFGAKT